MMNMIAIIMMIGMIKSWKYNDHHDNRVIIMISSHLSERCLKLPSVGGNCLPFNGAFSFPGSDDDGGDVAHCCTIFIKSSGYRHRNPNINTRRDHLDGQSTSGDGDGCDCDNSYDGYDDMGTVFLFTGL